MEKGIAGNRVLSAAEKQERILKWLYRVLPIIAILALIILWLAAASGPKTLMPAPSEIWERYLFMTENPIRNVSLLGHVLISLRRVFIALVIAWISGIALGVVMGWSPRFDALIGPLFDAYRAIPPLAWIPLITIWLGTGEFSKVLLVFMGAIKSVVVNARAGILNVDKLYMDVGTVFNANNKQKLFQIALPSATSSIFAGMRTSVSNGWMVVLAAEMLGSNAGVGFLVTRGMNGGDEPLVLLAMVCIGIVGALLSVSMKLLEGVLCPWTKKRKS